VAGDSKEATLAIDEASEAFNRGEYFDAAEKFELVTSSADNDDKDKDLKDLASALNRIAAALHLRYERGGRQSSINLLSPAMLALDDMKPTRRGIDIERLSAELAAYTEEVRATPRSERDGLKHRARIFLERRRAPKINLR